jgi:hypothetical protein
VPTDPITPTQTAEPPLSAAPVRKRPKLHLRRSEQIPMAAEFLDKAIGQIFIAIAVLDSHGSDPVARNAVIRMLRDDVSSDLDAASKIFEAQPPQSYPNSLLKRFLNWLAGACAHALRKMRGPFARTEPSRYMPELQRLVTRNDERTAPVA